MIVFDVVVSGEIVETLRPLNQRLRELQHYIHDRVEELKIKYGVNFEIYRRYVVLSA